MSPLSNGDNFPVNQQMQMPKCGFYDTRFCPGVLKPSYCAERERQGLFLEELNTGEDNQYEERQRDTGEDNQSGERRDTGEDNQWEERQRDTGETHGAETR